MSRERCDEVFALLAEFTLGGLDGTEHAAVMEHVEGCPRCRAELHELAEVADRVLTLAPEAEPPRGFGDRVLQVMRAEHRRHWNRPNWNRPHWNLGWAAAAAVVLLMGIAGVLLGTMGSDSSSPTASRTPTTPVVRTVAMTTAAGAPVGWVNQSGSLPVHLEVSVSYAVPDGDYTIELRTGTQTRGLGIITVAAGRGAWVGLAEVIGASATVMMVDMAGQTVCSAALQS
jgi:predicted anti-sigma-YlaC factor YlaD